MRHTSPAAWPLSNTFLLACLFIAYARARQAPAPLLLMNCHISSSLACMEALSLHAHMRNGAHVLVSDLYPDLLSIAVHKEAPTETRSSDLLLVSGLTNRLNEGCTTAVGCQSQDAHGDSGCLKRCLRHHVVFFVAALSL